MLKFLFTLLFSTSLLANTPTNMTFETIILEESQFSDVTKKFGPAKIHKQGDAGSSLASVCYTTKDKTFIKFASSEMGGGKFITEITITSNTVQKDCSPTTYDPQSLKFSNGLKLGLDQKEVQRLLGNPTKKKDKKFTYSIHKTLKDDFDELVTIELAFKEKLSHIKIIQVTTN